MYIREFVTVQTLAQSERPSIWSFLVLLVTSADSIQQSF